MTCKECDGKGVVEAFIDCGKPASECCGGCTKEIECDNCNGSGETNDDEEE